jgi:hypothetical protein
VQETFTSTQAWIGAAREVGARTTAPNFPDPNRSIASYMQSIGMSGGLDEFLAEARQQSRFNWRTEFTAQAVNAHIREGFGRPAQPGPLGGAGE